MCEGCVFKDIGTYIASGNVVFKADLDEAAVQAKLEAALQAYAGKPVGVVVRTDGSRPCRLVCRRAAERRVHNADGSAGVPASCLPRGFAAECVPYSIQFTGLRLGEGMLFRIAHVYEQATSWHDTHPNV
jgi:hypothetical protein